MKPSRNEILLAAGVLSSYPGMDHVVTWMKAEADVKTPKQAKPAKATKKQLTKPKSRARM